MDAAGHLIAGYTARGGDNHGASALKQVLAAVTAFLPVERDDVTHFWSGRVAVTKDHLPHIQELAPGLNAVLGFNGRGVAMATALGKLAAARIGDAADADSLFPVGPFLPWTFPATHRRLISLGINAYGFVDQWRNLVKSRRTRVTK
jgi:sarcosine oxidase